MDIYLKRRERENNYFYAFGQLAARDLTRVADIVSGRHIKDYFLKAKFKHEIKLFNEGNLQAISKEKNDNECKEAINNIKEEGFNLTRQGDMLSMRKEKIFLTITMERHNKKLVT